MKNVHWSDEDLINRLYGVGPEDVSRLSHLADCQDCSARLQVLEQRRGLFVHLAQSAQVSESQLRQQREEIWKKVERQQRPWHWKIAPAGATALLLMFALFLHRPAPQPEPVNVSAVQQMSDEQLFSEIASMVNETSPRAAQSMQALFDSKGAMEVQ